MTPQNRTIILLTLIEILCRSLSQELGMSRSECLIYESESYFYYMSSTSSYPYRNCTRIPFDPSAVNYTGCPILSIGDLNLFECAKETRHATRSRQLNGWCSATVKLYSVIDIQNYEIPKPLVLKAVQYWSKLSWFSLSVEPDLFIYTGYADLFDYNVKSYDVFTLEPNPLTIQVFPNIQFKSPAIYEEDFINTFSDTFAANFSSRVTGYILADVEEDLNISLMSNINANIWFCENCNLGSPNSICMSNTVCQYTYRVYPGRVYQFISDFKGINATDIQISITINSISKIYQASSLNMGTIIGYKCPAKKRHYNKEYSGIYYCPKHLYICNILDPENEVYAAKIPNLCLTYIWSGNNFICTTCGENASVVNGLCRCNIGYVETSGNMCSWMGFEYRMILYIVIIM